MRMYIEMLVVAAITIYIVDLSGFTQSWRSALARMLNIKEMRPIKPFDCGQCMTWWVCLCFAWASGALTIYTIGWSALLSFLSIPIGQVLMFVREGLCWMLNKMMPR